MIAAQLTASLEDAQGEAKSAFGNDAVFLERYIPAVRGIWKCRSWAIRTAILLHL